MDGTLAISSDDQNIDALTMIAEICNNMKTLQQKVQTEGLLLGAVAGAAAVYTVGIQNVLKFLYWVISSLANLIRWIIEKLGDLWKGIMNVFNRTTAENEAFLQQENVTRIGWAAHSQFSLLEAPAIVTFTGYDMHYNVDKLIEILITDTTPVSAYFSPVTDENKKLFDDHDDMLRAIALNRARFIIHSKRPMIDLSYMQFKTILQYEIFGDKIERSCPVTEAYEIVASYDQRKAKIKKAIDIVTNNCRRDLKLLDIKKAELTKNANLISGKFTQESFQQFNWLIEYRKTTMNDYLLVFEILMKYVQTINLQAKNICARVS